jgi:hypothetical protein
VTVLKEEKDSMLLKNQSVQDRLFEFEGLEGPGTGSIHRYNETLKQLDALKKEMFEVETCKLLYSDFSLCLTG